MIFHVIGVAPLQHRFSPKMYDLIAANLPDFEFAIEMVNAQLQLQQEHYVTGRPDYKKKFFQKYLDVIENGSL